MNTFPSFQILFQRSRYAREADQLAEGSRTNRKEIFAVAMVAFAFKHDPVFAEHFLKTVCGARNPSRPHAYSVEFQQAHCSDLLVRSLDGVELFVIEFKIDAPLQPKQDPTNRKSFLGTHGYGSQIFHRRAWRHFRTRSYIVLQNSRLFEGCISYRDIRCLARQWKNLVPKHAPQGLFADLLDSLSEFGIPSLKHWKGNTMNIASETKSAAQMWQLLCGILDDFKLSKRRRPNISQDDSESWFGLDWSSKPPGFEQLMRVVKPPASWAEGGWIGYRQVNGRSPEVSVWFFCGDSDEIRVRAMTWLHRRIPKRLAKSIHQDDNHHLFVAAPARTAEKDHAWFTEVFKSLSDR